jgi:hypothetical protein
VSKSKEVDPTQIPAVATFIDAEARLAEFKEEHGEIFAMYDQLVEERNTALQAAEKIVRAHQVTCGPFVLYQWQTKIDPEKFYDAVGRDNFLKLGGSIDTVPKYSVDKNTFEAKMATGAIPQNVVDAVVVKSPRYKCPDPITK